MYPKIVVCIPKQHESIVKAVNKIAVRQGLTPSKVALGIIMNFLKQTNQIKTQSYYKKRTYIKHILAESRQTPSSELVTNEAESILS
jgi:hypothetical protein